LILQTLSSKAVQSSAMELTDWLCCIRKVDRSMRGIRRGMGGEGSKYLKEKEGYLCIMEY